jgi:hypothetical protein
MLYVNTVANCWAKTQTWNFSNMKPLEVSTITTSITHRCVQPLFGRTNDFSFMIPSPVSTVCNFTNYYSSLGYGVAQWVVSLRYKLEGHWFHSQLGLWILHRLNISGHAMALGSTQPLDRNQTRKLPWGKSGQCVGLTTLPPSHVDCLKILVA